jgi:hypothetical protein
MELIFFLIAASIITFVVINRVKTQKEKVHSIQIRQKETSESSEHQKTITKIRINNQKLEDEDIITHLPEDIRLAYYTSNESYFDIEIEIVKAAKQKRDNYRKKTKIDNELFRRRMLAISYEKEKRYKEALDLFKKNIKQAEASVSFGVEFYPHDIKRVIILLGKFKLYDELRSFLQYQIEKHPNYHGMQDWAVRLTKLDNKTFKPEGLVLDPKKRRIPVAGNPTLGAKIDKCRDELPEFNFYFDLPEGMETIEYFIIHPQREAIHQKSLECGALIRGIDKVLARAKIAENEENFKEAIEAYEKLIAEEYEGRQPYERLMVIFRKLKWKEEELDLLQKGISFYENRKKLQTAKVLSLARKYGMEVKAKKYIAQNKKIHYYNGGFVLYDPCKFLDKWKLRFDKLNNQQIKGK